MYNTVNQSEGHQCIYICHMYDSTRTDAFTAYKHIYVLMYTFVRDCLYNKYTYILTYINMCTN